MDTDYIWTMCRYFSSFGLQQPTELVWTQLWPPGWVVTVWNRRATDSPGLWTPAGFATGSGTAGQAVPVAGPDTACSCTTEETATFQLEEMDLKKTTKTIPTLCYFCTLKSEALLRYFKLNPQWPLYVKASICIPKTIVSFFLAEQLKAIFLLLSSPLKRITFSTTDSLLCVVIMARVIRSDKRNEIFQRAVVPMAVTSSCSLAGGSRGHRRAWKCTQIQEKNHPDFVHCWIPTQSPKRSKARRDPGSHTSDLPRCKWLGVFSSLTASTGTPCTC